MKEGNAELIEGREAYPAAVLQLLALSGQSVALYSDSLPAFDYAASEAIQTLRRWLTSNKRAEVRVLVRDARQAMSESNALISLGLRMSSYVQFRDLPSNIQPGGDMLIIDRMHMLKRPQAGARSAALYLNQPLQVNAELKQFNQWWDEALPSTEIRSRTL